jgi:predicted transglutaminase-like protease
MAVLIVTLVQTRLLIYGWLSHVHSPTTDNIFEPEWIHEKREALSRSQIARWILEKLLNSFFISAIIIWGPIIGINISNYGMGTTYTIITAISLVVSLLAYILIPKDFGIVSGIRETMSSIRKFVSGHKGNGSLPDSSNSNEH